jgi:mono/diheme cytochrome c family protein
MRLDKLAIVTGAARGIGAETARASLALAALALALVPARAPAAEASLRFSRVGAPAQELSSGALAAACEDVVVAVDDPYYEKPKRFRAWPLGCVLERGFGAPAASLAGEEVLLRALDGYTRATDGAVLAEPGGYLAFADADRKDGGFDPIDYRQADPAPFYVIWKGPGEKDVVRYPWPYQLAEIELVRVEDRFPHAVPKDASEGSPARRGFELFRRSCLQCHAINGDGGRVGPELNVPQSIVAYRPEAQLRAFIRDPQQFRYTQMPANPQLSDADLDALLAYFRHMSAHPYDPLRGATESPARGATEAR